LFPAASRQFGTEFRCPLCGHTFELDTGHLARFELPATIVVRLSCPGRRPEEMADVVVLAEYGGLLPPVRTDRQGEARFAKEVFLKHIQQNAEVGLMEARGKDYGLIRFVRFIIPDTALLSDIAARRKSSGWPILSLERELFGDIDGLVDAYLHNRNGMFSRVDCTVDLYKASQDIRREIELEPST
jgi:hypothetical protein